MKYLFSLLAILQFAISLAQDTNGKSNFNLEEKAGYGFQLQDLLEIYGADTTSFQEIAKRKNYTLTVSQPIPISTKYRFTTGTDEKVYLDVVVINNGPNESRDFHYWFKKREEYRNFKKSIKAAGFLRNDTQQMSAPFSSYSIRYLKDDTYIVLADGPSNPPYLVWIFKKSQHN